MDLKYLNNEQIAAVLAKEQDILVLAGAGTGKTRVLTARVEYLLEQGVTPDEIVCFTFTNKAAREMKYRIRQAIGNEVAEQISISTFHSFFLPYLLPQLGYLGFTNEKIKIIKDNDQMIIINSLLDNIKTSFTNKEIQKYISNIKNQVELDIKEIDKQIEINKIFKLYQEKLQSINTLDIDDILYYFNKALEQDHFLNLMQTYKHILVDEAQDTNPVQYEILKKMRGENNNLYLCGDDDQAIYAFRGSDPFLIRRYIEDYNPKQIILTKNYRSLPKVVEASSNLIKNNKHRVEKHYETIRNKKAMIAIVKNNNNRHEGIQITSIIKQFIDHGYEYKDIAILYRNHNIVEHLEPYFLKYQIPHHTPSNRSFLNFEEIKLIINYYRLLDDNEDEVALTNVLNHKIFNFQNVFFTKLKTDMHKYKISLFQALKFYDELNEDVKYFFDKFYILQDEFNNYSILEFFDRLVYILGLEDYYLKQEYGQIHIQRINNFKEFLEDHPDTNPKKEIINIINNLTLDNLNNKNDYQNKVQFMTIHQAKGLEFPIVIIPAFEEGILPSSKAKTPLQIEEERRIAYVGISRAKDNCIIMTNIKRYLYGREHTQKESRFLNELIGGSNET